MKADELMVGDWVQPCIRSYPVQVESLSADTINGDMDATFDPIPLTPEILEKNGFENNPFDKRVWNWENARYHILLAQTRLHMSERTKNKILRYDITRLPKYVHELQHALRLCGIEKEIEL